MFPRSSEDFVPDGREFSAISANLTPPSLQRVCVVVVVVFLQRSWDERGAIASVVAPSAHSSNKNAVSRRPSAVRSVNTSLGLEYRWHSDINPGINMNMRISNHLGTVWFAHRTRVEIILPCYVKIGYFDSYRI